MFKFTKLTGAALALVMITLGFSSGTAQANDDLEYIYCSYQDLDTNRVYYSNIFKGDYGNSLERSRMESGFRDELENNEYVTLNYRYSVGCFFENTHSEAKAQKAHDKTTARFGMRHLDGETRMIETYWSYRSRR